MNENGVRSDVMLNHTWSIACGEKSFRIHEPSRAVLHAYGIII